ncbi:molybdopterin molybdenumtransferase MoeA [[Actinomadura] parvosata subsp. kistnae]|uniref:Molybdopterin molybdenumtransferase n=1 Tax=[Actinomadura] parvosata subsp. kistnae TaxID=1909395 RepID=A0A1V0A5Y2_9ACTN|nr:molybdopterin molybdotransferase MoeA [Nonomuraea sp. ATCC 55076]AQZ65600.1 molybdopterin molybdenumtransferase MoeA [Nonomuraea sp. ATCC 55076]
MSWGSARALAAGAACPLKPREVPLQDALGCRLAAPLRALVPVPGVDVAAMDGYAVSGPRPWRVLGRVLAGGAPHAGPLRAGEAVEIATGAPVPEGTSSVLPWELASVGDGRVDGAAEPGRHMRRRGEDIPEGTAVLGAGAVVTPVALGLAAALGHDTLPVRPRPQVAVLVTGDEVVTEGLPGPGRVRDAIGPFLPGLVRWAGGRVTDVITLPDGPQALHAALGSPGDVVVVCGASSQGPADHLRAVLGDLGADVLVDGVAVRPGHPQLLARLPGGRLLVGLPGNPFAALAAALTLLAPVLCELAGTPAPRETSALAGPVRTHPRDTRLVPVRRSARGAVPVGHDRPGSLWGAALADALAVVPAGWAGEQVELIELPPGV